MQDIQNYIKVNNNKNFKGNSKLLLDSDRRDKTTKEKYISKFFKTKGIEINKLNKEKNNDIYNTIREDSKINKFSRNNIINLDNNQKFNKSHMIGNESMNNLKHELNYEYEIRLLNKKLKTLQKTNNKLKVKIFNLKKEQNRNKQKFKKENIISQVIMIYNQYINKNREHQINKYIEFQTFPDIKSFKNMLLNIMDWKFNYENKLMTEQFFIAIKSILNSGGGGEINDKSSLKEINLLLKKRNILKHNFEEIQLFLKQNQSIKKYFTYLCEYFFCENLEELRIFLKNNFILYKHEFKEINRMKNSVLQNTRNKNINLSFDKITKLKNEYNHGKKPAIKRSNSQIDVHINSRNIDEINSSIKGSFRENKLFYTYREYNPNNHLNI